MEELQHRLRPNSERTLAEANAHLEHLKQQEVQCIDSIDQIVFLPSFVPSSTSSPELVRLQQQKSLLKKEMKFVQLVITTFDSSASNERAYSSVGDALSGLSRGTNYNKDFVLSLLFWLFSSRNKICSTCRSWIENAPESIRCDRDINFCYLNTTDFDYSFLANMPTHLWEHKDVVVIAVAHVPEVLRLGNRGQSRVPHRFLDDQDVFLAFANSKRRDAYRYTSHSLLLRDEDIRRLLSQFSTRIRANAKLMRMLVEKYPLCASHVDQSLMENREFRDFVLERTIGESLEEYCKEYFRDPSIHGTSTRPLHLLLQQLAFHSNGVPVLVRFLDRRHSTWCRFVYEAAPDHLQRHPDIVYAMLRNGHLMLDQIPETAHPRGRDFWLHATSHRVDSSLWLQLPNQFKKDPEFLEAFRFIDQSAIETALGDVNVHGLAANRAFWFAVFHSQFEFGHYLDVGVFLAHAPLEFRRDRELMLLACKEDAMYYQCCHESLQGDEEILTAAIEASYTDFFFSIPQHVQNMYPHLTAQALYPSEEPFTRFVRLEEVAQDLHSNMEVMQAYFECNDNAGPDRAPELPDAMRSSQDFALFVAQRCSETWEFEASVSVELRSDKEFMERAVTRNPICLAAGAGELAKDFDLAVIAVGQECHNRDLVGEDKQDDDYESERDFLYSVAAKAREQVMAYEGFTKGFLVGLTDNPGRECKLPMLNQGNETSTSWKKTIAEYAGVPNGNKIHQLRAAALRLLIPREDEYTFPEQP